MHKIIVALSMVIYAIPHAAAEDWSSIIKEFDREVLVDIDSYQMKDGYPFMIYKTIYQSAHIDPAHTTKPYFTSVKAMLFNCKTPLFRLESIALFDQHNKPMNANKVNTDFSPITAGSDVFSVGQLTCQVHQMLGGQ